MFDQYVFSENSCRNIEENGKVAGFSLKTRITYYRGIPLSMVHDVTVKVDGKDVPRESIRFSVDGEDWFTLDEMTTVTSYKWEYGREATIKVLTDGGLPKGEHAITLGTMVRVAYIPVPFGGEATRTVRIA